MVAATEPDPQAVLSRRIPSIRLRADFGEHPQFVEAGPLATLLWLNGLAYSVRNGTDGFIPEGIVTNLMATSFRAPDNEDTINIAMTARQRLMADLDGDGRCGWDLDEETVEYLLAYVLVHVGLWEYAEHGYQVVCPRGWGELAVETAS